MFSSVWGRILGGFFGYAVAGPLGALFGILIGNFFDRGFNVSRNVDPRSLRGETRRVFNDVTFSVMGHIAKSDGRVSEDEIDKARDIMKTLRLTAVEQREAIRSFSAGKSESFQLDLALTELKHVCRQQPALIKMFVELQYRAVSPDARRVNVHKQKLLNIVFERLGYLPVFNTAQTSQQNQQNSQYNQYRHYQQRQDQHYTPPTYVDELAEAYKTLSISSESTASDIKKAYRKKMSQHHPDKLIARGLSESQVKQGTVEAQKIQAAYERVKQARGF